MPGRTSSFARILPHVHGALAQREEEVLEVSAADDRDEGVALDGVVRVGALAPEKLLVVADALAKSAAVANDERHIAEVFDTVEPWARRLADGAVRAAAGR
jgi:hypothetical protein